MSENIMEMRKNNLGGGDLSLNNRVSISGFIDKEFEFSHRVFGENFYATRVRIMRKSGVDDYVPVIVPEILIKEHLNHLVKDKFVIVKGQFRSLNVQDENQKSHLNLFLFAKSFEFFEEGEFFENEIHLTGYLCKMPVFRETPFGRQIADVMLAVNRRCNKSDYIPCILWGRNANIVKEMQVGDKIELCGRVQSRTYLKHSEELPPEEKVAYEISVQYFSKL